MLKMLFSIVGSIFSHLVSLSKELRIVARCCYKFILYPPCVGVLYRDAGNISLAVDAYEQCLKIDPDSRNAGQVFCFVSVTQKKVLFLV